MGASGLDLAKLPADNLWGAQMAFRDVARHDDFVITIYCAAIIFRQARIAQGNCTEGLRHRFIRICGRRIKQSEGKVAIMEIPPKIKEYIDNNRGSLPPITDPDEPLHLDSLSFIHLVAFLESEGYLLADEELIADNFATLRKLGELLATKTPTVPTGELEAAPR